MATAAPVQPAAPRRGIRALLARHQLVSFFVLAFAGTWLTELPYVLSEYGAGLLPTRSPVLAWTSPVSIFMGPFLAAFLMTGATEGREGVGRFLRRFVLWRVGFRWYLFAFVGIPVIGCSAWSSYRVSWDRLKGLVPWPPCPCSVSLFTYSS
jgi:hypothetical protein